MKVSQTGLCAETNLREAALSFKNSSLEKNKTVVVKIIVKNWHVHLRPIIYWSFLATDEPNAGGEVAIFPKPLFIDSRIF